tara:strand:- start:109 stop:513 length:405 start_codon:yes stop_codon:yes gene_type:complete
MGNYLDTTWYIYRRVLSTDEWVGTPLQTWPGLELDIVLSRFKHEIYSFSLGKHVEYTDTKSIYLYNNRTRVAKALKNNDTGQLDIWSISIREWMGSKEELSPYRYPLHKKEFFTKYVNKHAWKNTQTITYVKKE